jgi:TRAP-type C4-dicarboxylate transport system substrate-binding protein
MKIVRGLAGCLLVASSVLATSCGGRAGLDKAGRDKAGAPVVLTLANHEQGPVELQAWADAVQRLSNGTLRIRVLNNWRIPDRDYDRRTIGDVRSGRVALAKIAVRAYDTVGVTNFQPLVAPFLIDSPALESRVLSSRFAQRALGATARLGLTGLALLPGQLRRPVGMSRTLLEPADFRGARIATREGQVAEATFRALGADPIELPYGSSLSPVDGAELSFEVLKDNRSVRDAGPLTTNLVFWPKAITVVMNADRFASLTRRQQQALRDAGPAAFGALMKKASESDDEARHLLCRIGTPFVRARSGQLAALRAAVQPVYAQVERGTGNAATLRQIEAIKGDAAPDAPVCKPGETSKASAGGHATPIDGDYRTSFSKRELEDSPDLADKGEINDGNWGAFTLHLTHGRLTATQRNAHTRTTSTGRYTLSGNAIRLHIDQTDETFAVRWNLYRDTLKFQPDKKLGIIPTPFLVKPWRRIGS